MSIESNLRAFSWAFLGIVFYLYWMLTPWGEFFGQPGQAVMKPMTAEPGIYATRDSDVTLTVAATPLTPGKGSSWTIYKLWVDRDQVQLEQRFEVFRNMRRLHKERVVLKADARLCFGDVIRVLEDLRDAGYTRVILNVRTEEMGTWGELLIVGRLVDAEWTRRHLFE